MTEMNKTLPSVPLVPSDSFLGGRGSPSLGREPYPLTLSVPERRVFRVRDRIEGRPVTTSEWADRHRVVTEGGRRGPWSTSFTEYSRQAMDAFNLPWIRQIILCWGPQTSKTQVALNCIGYSADQDPGPAMWIVPSEKKAGDAVNKKLMPMIRTSKRLADLLSPRAQDSTKRSIRFTNGMEILVTWASSASELASESIRYLVLDETDKYSEYTGREADPVSLAEQRINAYPHNYKILKISTPTLEGGVIWTALTQEADEVWDFWVPCPVCGKYQVMKFEFCTWPSDIKDWRTILRNRPAYYSCCHCGFKWNDRAKNEAVRRGYWKPREAVPGGRPAVIALHLPSWYSPFISFSRVAANYLKGLDDPAKMLAHITQDRAEGHSERVETKKEDEVLEQHRCELPPMIVPKDAVALTAGIDTHKSYFRFVVKAWTAPSAGFHSYTIHYGDLASFEDIETLLDASYPVEDSEDLSMGIWRAAIDTGGTRNDEEKDGSRTEQVYAFLKANEWRRQIYGVKGGSSKNPHKKIALSTVGAVSRRAFKTPQKSQINRDTLELRVIDTTHFKLNLHFRIARTPDQTRQFFLHSETDQAFVRELLAEELHKDRKGNYYWKQVRAQNHYLDCETYALACADPEWAPNLTLLSTRGKLRLLSSPGELAFTNRSPMASMQPQVRRVLSRGVEL